MSIVSPPNDNSFLNDSDPECELNLVTDLL